MSRYEVLISVLPGGSQMEFAEICERYWFEANDFEANKNGPDYDALANDGNGLVAALLKADFILSEDKIEGLGLPVPNQEAIGHALTILIKHAGTPAAIALDVIASGRSEILSSTAGEWSPALCFDRVQTLIDAEMRLGTGGDMQGVARQVAGLMLIALERLTIEGAAS